MSEKQNKIFPDGIRFEKPNEKAPGWVKGKISIKVDKFMEFAQKNQTEKGWLNLDLKEAKNGTLYLELNTWKKAWKPEERPKSNEIPEIPPDLPDDIEF